MSSNEWMVAWGNRLIGTMIIMTLVMTVARLGGLLELSYLWILAPLWIPCAIAATGIVLFFGLVCVLVSTIILCTFMADCIG